MIYKITNLNKLPVGTTFEVHNGNWIGKIIEVDNQKWIVRMNYNYKEVNRTLITDDYIEDLDVEFLSESSY